MLLSFSEGNFFRGKALPFRGAFTVMMIGIVGDCCTHLLNFVLLNRTCQEFQFDIFHMRIYLFITAHQ